MDHTTDILTIDKPFKIKLGFAKLIHDLEEILTGPNTLEASIAQSVLDLLPNRDQLVEGFGTMDDCEPYMKEIKILLGHLFPPSLRTNEIKIAITPLTSRILFNTSRFKNIFGNTLELDAREFESVDEDIIYIYMCTFILKGYYGAQFDITSPPVYPVKNKEGVIKYYKSTYNAEFMNMKPLNDPPEISSETMVQLKENLTDIELWKSIFPVNSWEISGFGMKSFTDVTNEEVLSLIKNNLIGNKSKEDHCAFKVQMNSYMSTLINVSDTRISFNMYDEANHQFLTPSEKDESYGLNHLNSCGIDDLLCEYGMEKIFEKRTSFIIPNLDALPEEVYTKLIYINLKKQGVKSYIMTPLYDGDKLLGALEFVSNQPNAYDHTHIYKIANVVDLCTNAVKQYADERENELTAIIQNEFTAIHPSVAWKFREEAERYARAQIVGEEYNFNKIIFKNLTALYGQMDIAGSSTARNRAIAADLKKQMTLVREIISEMNDIVKMPLLESIRYQIAIICEKLNSDLAAGMEQEVTEFLRNSINPLLEEMRHRDDRLEIVIAHYFEQIESDMEIVYEKRKDYDDSVKLINMHLSQRLDAGQTQAQRIFPHYFERYKTDGVEHNMFIGQELAPKIKYNKLYLDNLRLWQLKTICELEIEHHQRKHKMPVELDVASLIMVYSNPLAIRYRMDEKQFDIDGAYNARYEIIKKRIDKAHIKGTNERITQVGKIVMIYTQPGDVDEYLNYVNFLTYEGYLKGDPELFDIEDLQGVIGLKGLRVEVNFEKEEVKKDGSNEESVQRTRAVKA